MFLHIYEMHGEVIIPQFSGEHLLELQSQEALQGLFMGRGGWFTSASRQGEVVLVGVPHPCFGSGSPVSCLCTLTSGQGLKTRFHFATLQGHFYIGLFIFKMQKMRLQEA